MDVKLYTYTGDRRILNKYLTLIQTVNIIAITDDTNILNPTIIIDTRAFNFNYVYIPDFNRYYYVDDITLMGGERIALKLSCDVLMSHKAAILSSQVLADRSASNYDVYLEDNTIPTKKEGTIYVRNNGTTPFNTTSYVLQVAGR